MKQVDATYELQFTTEDAQQLPAARQMNIDLQELFAAVLDSYLSDKNISANEVHLMLCDELFIEDHEF